MIGERIATLAAARRTIDGPKAGGVGPTRDPGRLARALAGYGIAALLSLGLCAWALQLWRADLSIPFAYDWDNLLNHLWVKTLIERGWYLHNDAVGAPGGLAMHDFPLVDSLFFAILKLIAWASGDVATTINLYALLTFPLTTLTTLASLRHLGVSYGPSLVAALLYTFQPFHFAALGAGHLFLASYFLIPPMVAVLLRVYLDRDATAPGGEWSPRGRVALLRGAGLGTVAICALMSCGGVYYAFFSCFLLLVVGVAAAFGRSRIGPLLRSGMLIGVIVAGVLANVAPKLLHDLEFGANPRATQRSPAEAEIYGLRLIGLMAPVPHHRLGAMVDLYDEASRTLPTFGTGVFSIGATASVGFLLLMGRLFARRPSDEPSMLDGLALLNLAAVLLAVAGGFGSLFAFLVSPMIRCYVRINIVIACLSLFALAMLADRLRSRLTVPRRRRAFAAALGLVAVMGILDQTTPAMVPPYDDLTRAYSGDAEFVRRVEDGMPARAMVFQLPNAEFPEQSVLHGTMGHYDHLRPYLHSQHLRWSYGAMKGRPGDLWRAWIDTQPPEQMVDTLVHAGFSGISIERAGYGDGAAGLEAELSRLLGAEPRVVSQDGSRSFFDLRDHAGRLRTRSTADEWAAREQEALFPIIVRWGLGFHPEERTPEAAFRWSERLGELILANPSDEYWRVSVAMRVIPGSPGPSTLRIRGPGWRDSLPIDQEGRDVVRELVLPPGETRIHFACDGPPLTTPDDPRPQVFRVEAFSCSRLDWEGSPSVVAQAGALDYGPRLDD